MSPVDRYGDEQEPGGAPSGPPPSRPPWETVPAGTKPAICGGHKQPGGSCRAEVFWIRRPRMKKGAPVPGTSVLVSVDCAVDGGQRPNSLTDGKGLNHFGNCPDAERFHRKRT